MTSQHRLQSNSICCNGIYHKTEKSTFLSKSQNRPGHFWYLQWKKSMAFIIYQYLNSLLTLNSSLKNYFAASPEHQVNTRLIPGGQPIASEGYHRIPGKLSSKFEINSLTLVLPILLTSAYLHLQVTVNTSIKILQTTNQDLLQVAWALFIYIIQISIYYLNCLI